MCMQISDFNSSTLSLVTLSKPKPYDNATLVDAKAQKQSSSLGRVILTFSSGAVRSKTLSHFIWGNGSPPESKSWTRWPRCKLEARRWFKLQLGSQENAAKRECLLQT